MVEAEILKNGEAETRMRSIKSAVGEAQPPFQTVDMESPQFNREGGMIMTLRLHFSEVPEFDFKREMMRIFVPSMYVGHHLH